MIEECFYEDFSEQYEIESFKAKWMCARFGMYVADDGEISKNANGISVIPKGVNQKTGLPAFSKTCSPQKGGVLDHIKWMIQAEHHNSDGTPGFKILPGKTIKMETVAGGELYGVDKHPFGDAVTDPDSDFRLGALAMVNMDPDTNIVFDFFLTNAKIYALYERTPLGRKKYGNYASFSFAIPLMDRKPGEIHHLAITYNRDTNTARWFVEGKEKFKVENIGNKIDRKYMFIDAGGEDQIVCLDRITCGLGMFTVMDGTLDGRKALVNLSGTNDGYCLGTKEVLTYVDAESRQTNRLFGQGAKMICNSFAVSYF